MSEEKKYITLENLAYFLEKFKDMMSGRDKEKQNIESSDSQKEIEDNG